MTSSGRRPPEQSPVEDQLRWALQLLRRVEWGIDVPSHPGRCLTCGYPKEWYSIGHPGPGGHEPGCSLYAVLNGLPAPRLDLCTDATTRATAPQSSPKEVRGRLGDEQG